MYPNGLFELLVVSLTLPKALAAAATCYFPSGDVATGNVPCNNATTGFSNCCGSAEGCLANGLCLVNTDTDTVEFGRGACTDQSWGPDCFQKCTGLDTGDPMTNGAAVFECGTVGFQNKANYCCENGIDSKTACCSSSALIFQLAAGTPTGGTPGSSPTPSPSSTSTTASPSTTSASTVSGNENDGSDTTTTASKQSTLTVSGSTSPSASATTTAPAGSAGSTGSSSSNPAQPAVSPVDQGTSNTTKIAVGVAVPVGVLLAALLGFLVWNNHRNSKKIRDLQAGLGDRNGTSSGPMTGLPMSKDGVSTSPNQGYSSQEYYKPNTYTRSMHELNGQGRPHELDQATEPQRPFELDSGHYRR